MSARAGAPADWLAAELRGRNAVEVARGSRVTPRAVRHAMRSRQVGAGNFLKLCAFLGVDPVTGERRPPREIGELLWWFLAAGVFCTRGLRRLSLRDAAPHVGVSYSTLSRLECRMPVSVDAFLAACRFVGVHPYGFTGVAHAARANAANGYCLPCFMPAVSRETSTATFGGVT